MSSTNGKQLIQPQAVKWHDEFGPPVRRHKVSRSSAPRTNWGDRFFVLGLVIFFAAIVTVLVVALGGLLYFGAELMRRALGH